MFTPHSHSHPHTHKYASIKCNTLSSGRGKLDENKKKEVKQIMMHFTNYELLNLRMKAFCGVSLRCCMCVCMWKSVYVFNLE